MSYLSANSRHCLDWVALLMSLLGTKWSSTMLTRVLSKTESKPALLNSLMATGVVISLPSTMSSLALMSWPAVTAASPQWAAKIFWVMVMPMVVYLRFVFFGFPLGGSCRPQATDEGQVCRRSPYADWLRKLCPHPSAPGVAATFPRRGRQGSGYLLLIALTKALMPATIISVWVPQPQVSSPEAHFRPT